MPFFDVEWKDGKCAVTKTTSYDFDIKVNFKHHKYVYTVY